MGAGLNLAGDKYGKLTVISEKGRTNAGQKIWNCKCDCGKSLAVTGGQLRSGKTKSCGCIKKRLRLIDISGKKFYRLLVRKCVTIKKFNYPVWECVCDCGNKVFVRGADLRRGHSKSCGCYSHEVTRETLLTHGQSGGGKQSNMYMVWNAMKLRCNNPKNKNYKNYGGRGIKVCKEWEDDFAVFYRDMGDRPSSLHSLDRIDNSGKYEPSNCRWATRAEQSRNNRRNRWIEYNGEKMILMDWANRLKVKSSQIIYHLKTKSFKEVFKYYTS